MTDYLKKFVNNQFGPDTDVSEAAEIYSQTFTTEDEAETQQSPNISPIHKLNSQIRLKMARKLKLKNKKSDSNSLTDSEGGFAVSEIDILNYFLGFFIGLIFNLFGLLLLQRCKCQQKKKGGLHGLMFSCFLVYPVVVYVWVTYHIKTYHHIDPRKLMVQLM